MLRSIPGAAGTLFLLAAWGARLALCAGQAPTTVPPQSAPTAPPASAQAASPDQQLPDALPIGAGDILQISVWKEPDASVPSVVVRPDGMITVPLLKDLQVVGRTPRDVEKLISTGLGKYIDNPNVTVVVAASNSKKVYVIGGVNREGPLPYTYRMTVLQALSEAGGLRDDAKRTKIYIIRTESGRDYRLDFNYDEAIKGMRMDQNILLQPGDTLVIPH
jgi:polysaccharide export outer membrane protein